MGQQGCPLTGTNVGFPATAHSCLSRAQRCQLLAPGRAASWVCALKDPGDTPAPPLAHVPFPQALPVVLGRNCVLLCCLCVGSNQLTPTNICSLPTSSSHSWGTARRPLAADATWALGSSSLRPPSLLNAGSVHLCPAPHCCGSLRLQENVLAEGRLYPLSTPSTGQTALGWALRC